MTPTTTARSALTWPRLVGAAAVGLLFLTWLGSGSFVMALLVLVLVAGTAGLAWMVVSSTGRGPRGGDGSSPVLEALPTTDLAPPTASDRVRRAVRGLLGRPWVHGDGLIRAAARRLASEESLVWTPRGQRVAAPHLWVEFHPDDLADVAARWPLEVLADELLSGYLEHARDTDARRLAERTFLHLLAGADVPVGRVLVTAAFSRPAATPVATASAVDPTPSSLSSPPAAPPISADGSGRPPSPPGPRPAVPRAGGRPGRALPPPPRPAQARGPAGAPRDTVGGSRGAGGARSPYTEKHTDAPGTRTTVVTPTAGPRPGSRRGATLVQRVAERARDAARDATRGRAPTPVGGPREEETRARPRVSWGRPAGPRRDGGG
ncbi:hypothetical protein [Actinomycetospora callitridis]|uniref:hypothetical protein n=1 Tax=Actinomycetospora callitridis TaxID=913944 RepID=UPI002366868D|nr:hypothetical protein [Actinomycetospora callitridis]MDD7920702.1 hypothetical protein [Actinomycetospora callitridis]